MCFAHLAVLFLRIRFKKKLWKNPQNIFLLENTTESWKSGQLLQRTVSIHSALRTTINSANCFVSLVHPLKKYQKHFFYLKPIEWDIQKLYFLSDFIELCNQEVLERPEAIASGVFFIIFLLRPWPITTYFR